MEKVETKGIVYFMSVDKVLWYQTLSKITSYIDNSAQALILLVTAQTIIVPSIIRFLQQ